MTQPPFWDYLSERNTLLPQVQVIWDASSGLYRPVNTADLTTVNISGLKIDITGIDIGPISISGASTTNGQLNVYDSGVVDNTTNILNELSKLVAFQETGASEATLTAIAGIAKESTLSAISGALTGISYESGGLKVFVVNQSTTSLSNVAVENSGLNVNAKLEVANTLHSNGFVNQLVALSGSGTFLTVNGYNNNTNDVYIQLYDDVIPSGFPLQFISVLGKENFFIDYEAHGLEITNGITVAVSTLPTGFSAPIDDSCYFTVRYLQK